MRSSGEGCYNECGCFEVAKKLKMGSIEFTDCPCGQSGPSDYGPRLLHFQHFAIQTILLLAAGILAELGRASLDAVLQ